MDNFLVRVTRRSVPQPFLFLLVPIGAALEVFFACDRVVWLFRNIFSDSLLFIEVDTLTRRLDQNQQHAFPTNCKVSQ